MSFLSCLHYDGCMRFKDIYNFVDGHHYFTLQANQLLVSIIVKLKGKKKEGKEGKGRIRNKRLPICWVAFFHSIECVTKTCRATITI